MYLRPAGVVDTGNKLFTGVVGNGDYDWDWSRIFIHSMTLALNLSPATTTSAMIASTNDTYDCFSPESETPAMKQLQQYQFVCTSKLTLRKESFYNCKQRSNSISTKYGNFLSLKFSHLLPMSLESLINLCFRI